MSKRYRHVHTEHARSGHLEPLAKHLEKGGELLPCMREFVVAHLRGSIKFKRGARRTFAQKQLDREIGDEVRVYEELFKLSRSQAVAMYLSTHPNTNQDTLKSILDREKREREETKQRIKNMLEEQC